ncbi:MAG: hypothetical protein ACFNOP_03640, partial [Bacteroides sp.]
YNIERIAPYLWNLVTDEVKSEITNRFVLLKEKGNKEQAHEAFLFIKLVGGVEFIPSQLKGAIFMRYAQYLIDTHYAWGNFYHEPNYARELMLLGTSIPKSVIPKYVKAVTLSFVGNYYGVSWAAQEYNIKMIAKFSPSCIEILFRILKSDIELVRELCSSVTCKRLQEMMPLLNKKTMNQKSIEMFNFIEANSSESLRNYFEKCYKELS